MNDQPRTTPPSNYLILAIITTIFCCQIFGIVSIVYAAQVNSKWASGDTEGAIQASKNAKLWAILGIVSGVAIALFFIVLAVFGVLAGLTLGGLEC